MLKTIILSARILLVFCLLIIGLSQTDAQGEGIEPVVFGVLFFSPTCPHCHEVIDNHVPLWQQEFGDSLQLLFIDVTQQGGSMLAYATCDALGIESCGSVPMLVVGETVMIGSAEIPARMPDLVRNGLANGGIGLPPVAELQQAYNQLMGVEDTVPAQAAEEAISEIEDEPVDDPVVPAVIQTETVESASWIDKVKRDPEGNAVAIAVLIGLVVSFSYILWLGSQPEVNEDDRLSRWVKIVILVAGIVIAGTLLSESSGDTLAMAMSGGILILLLWSAIAIGMSEFTNWLIPLAAGAGLLDAIYLSQIETSSSEITCGLIGDCGTVQQSTYAELFGVLPIGVLGVVAYVLILLLWAILTIREDMADYAQVALFGLILLGVAFSIYLTFLEPFVIGATCMWCITSALTMLLLLWLVAPAGWSALRRLREPDQEARHVHASA